MLLPSSLLPRRRDDAQVIGAALLAHAGGQGHRPIAAQLDRPAATVRGWLRPFDLNAERLRVTAAIWLYRLDPMADVSPPSHSVAADALEALARATRALRLRMGGGPGGVWDDINSLVGASLLAPARR